MYKPHRAGLLMAASLAMGTQAAPAEAYDMQHELNQPQAALDVEASQLIVDLGSRVLALQKSASRNRHLQNMYRFQVAPAIRGVSISYYGKRTQKYATTGTYTLFAAFDTSDRQELNANNIIEVGVSQNAGGKGPRTSLNLHRDQNSTGYAFTGRYSYPQRHFNGYVYASTQPDTKEQQLSSSNLREIGERARDILKNAPKGGAPVPQVPIGFPSENIAGQTPENPNQATNTSPSTAELNPDPATPPELVS